MHPACYDEIAAYTALQELIPFWFFSVMFALLDLVLVELPMFLW